MRRSIEELLETPCWIIDILPERVPADGGGQYFAIERYYLTEPQYSSVRQKKTGVILKLNCYRTISLGETDIINPPPEQLAEAIRSQYVNILIEKDSMIVSDPGDTHMTLYNPDEELLRLVKAIAGGEGLFVWQP